MNTKDHPFVVVEIAEPGSCLVPELDACLAQTFPTYTPYFRTILTAADREHDPLRPRIFAGVREGHAVGFLQLFLRKWGDGVVGWIDVLGVISAHRELGIATALVKRSIAATREVAVGSGSAALGVASAIDPDYVPVVRLHTSLGGQIRGDLSYQYDLDPKNRGDVIVWYPLRDDCRQIPTKALAWQVWQFGGLPKEEFVRRYGPTPDAEGNAPANRSDGDQV